MPEPAVANMTWVAMPSRDEIQGVDYGVPDWKGPIVNNICIYIYNYYIYNYISYILFHYIYNYIWLYIYIYMYVYIYVLLKGNYMEFQP